MKKSKMMVSLLTLTMSMGLMFGCSAPADTGNKDTKETKDTIAEAGVQSTENTGEAETERAADGHVSITDGYYHENSTGLNSFYRFNEDGSYYAKFFDGGVVDTGTWQILDESLEYSTSGGADEDWGTVEDNDKATAPQIVEVTSYLDGSVIKMAYDGDKLCDIVLGGMAGNKTMAHEADYNYVASVEEVPIIIAEFYANNSVGSMLTLNHDKTFGDTTGDLFLNGTWEMTDSKNYKLTYADETTAVLAIGEDGKSAVLTLADGSAIELADRIDNGEAAVAVMTLEAKDAQVGLPMGVDLLLNAYDDGTCELAVYVAAIDTTIVADTGTYAVDAAMQFTFTFENAGEIAGVPNYDSATESGIEVTAEYVADVVIDNAGTQTPLSIRSALTGYYAPQ
ncbi:MAG: hypothetical protein ACLU94_03470 [Catenibacillus sp.]